MSILDFAKATVACGGLAFLIYHHPVFSQVLLLSMLGLLWLLYARRTVQTRRRRKLG